MSRAIAALVVLALSIASSTQAQPPSAVHSFRPGAGQASGQEPRFFPQNILGWPDSSARRDVPSIAPEQIASLGLGGEIVLRFDHPIIDAAGPDFTIFENAFYYTIGPRERLYAEPAVVAVSRDGVRFETFPFDSLTLAGLAGTAPTHGDRDPTDPRVSGGNSFDLSLIDVDSIHFVRITDATSIVLNNPSHPNWDATLTGFDLDAVIAIPPDGRGAATSSALVSAASSSHPLALFPNPASNHVDVRVRNARTLRVVDRLGVVVVRAEVDAHASRVVLDTRALSAGAYVVELTDGHGARHVVKLQIVR